MTTENNKENIFQGIIVDFLPIYCKGKQELIMSLTNELIWSQ